MKLEPTAYHEAGHAVASWCLHVPIRHVTIISDDTSAGHVQNHKMNRRTALNIELDDRFSLGRLRAEKLVMVAMAGPLAQERYAPRSVRYWHGGGDRDAITELLIRYADTLPDGSLDCRAHGKLLKQWTRTLLENNWYLVEAVAAALLERRRLSGSETRDVILDARNRQYKEAAARNGAKQ